MFGWSISFYQPMWLWLLVLLPLLWWFSYKSLAGLGKFRRILALGLRTFLLVLFAFVLAEIQFDQVSEKLTVIYVIDQSQSIPQDKRQAMFEYVRREVQKHRDPVKNDRAGVIVFASDAVIDTPPFDEEIYYVSNIESFPDLKTDATNLASALKLAHASFPENSAKRVVVVTDGNENLGNVRKVARAMAADGIGIDVTPVELDSRAEISVAKITLPNDVRQGQTIETVVIVEAFTNPGEEGKAIPGTLRVTRHIGREGSQDEVISESHETLTSGKNFFRFKHKIEAPAPYTYKATFVPDNADDDATVKNNTATAFTHVQGKGRVLLIEDWQNRGDFDHLVNRLRANNVEVDLMGSDQLFSDISELQFYDSVVLANVPRSSGDDAETISNFSDAQIEALVHNTHELGCGLVMLGGQQSFGAGGWSNTKLEEAMPVDFQIKNSKIQAVGALVLLMHASEMAQGNHWQKVVAREAIKALGPMDYCGLLHWSGTDQWLWGGNQGLVRVGPDRKNMMARVDRMTPGDMPQFDPAMRLALSGLNSVNASVKHMIIISDGDPSGPSPALMQQFVNAKTKIQISTVAVGTHGAPGATSLQQIAAATGGKYYVVKNPKALPRIYQREARRVARPLMYEPDGGVSPAIVYPHEMLGGVEGPLANIRGYMRTTIKDSPLVEVAIRDPNITDPNIATILASWNYGNGRTVAFTSDAGHRWADSWISQPYYDKLYSQMIRWSMRPINESGKFTVSTNAQDGKVQVVVTALDEEDAFLNHLSISGSALGPDMERIALNLQQESSGRYVGEFDAADSGSYFLALNPGADYSLIRGGVTVPFSSEFTDREANLPLLEELASQVPRDGEVGELLVGEMSIDDMDELLKYDTFRRTLPYARSSDMIWPFVLWFAMFVFFVDIFIRRVSIGFEWLAPVNAWFRANVLREELQPQPDERMARLRSRKAELTGELDQRRASARFEPQTDDLAPDELTPTGIEDVVASAGPEPRTPQRPTSSSAESLPDHEEESYTDRLKRAKERAKRERGS